MNVRTYEVNPFAIDTVRIIPVGAYSSGGISDEAKQAILDAFEHVAWTDDQGQTYVDAIRDAFFPPATLLRIQAVYTQSGTVYPTDSLDSLKSDLVVTAVYTDSSTETVTTYTLSGTLTAGESTITVSYGGKTTTFKVNVTAPATLDSISAVYTQSGTVYDTDSLDSLKTNLVVTATYSDSSTSTVAAADYTLSGTLTEGTSTITVTYGGKTATFTATVTHGFLYVTEDGLLSEQSYVTYTNTTNSLTETLTNDGTRIYSPKVSTQAGNCKWEFLDYNLVSDCEMTVQFKIVSLGYYSSTNAANLGYVLAAIYDGETGGGVAGFARYNNGSGAIKIRTANGDTVAWNADVSVNVWHEVKITVSNGLQTVTLDGSTIVSNQNPSTRINYGENTMIRAGESNSGINDVYIRRIEFKEIS